MRILTFLAATALLAAAPASAHADDPYCSYVDNIAAAQAAVLVAPELFGSAGLVNAGSELTGDSNVAFETGLRVTVGLRYDFADLYRGLVTDDAAAADCRRYLALQHLEAYLDAGREAGVGAAAAAQLQVLDELLPQAEARLREVRDEVEAGRAGLEELNATQLRVADLRSRAADARLAAERDNAPDSGGRSLGELRRTFLEADAALAAAEADVREATAWEVGIRGGYDQVIGDAREVPIFALVSVGWSFGQPFQRAAHNRAADARRAWVASGEGGTAGRAEELRRELIAVRGVERQRLAEAQVLLADLQARLQAVQDLESSRLRRFADALWFEWARLRVEEAGLAARLAALDGLLGS